MAAVLRFITEPRLSGYFFASAALLVYGIAPLAIDYAVQPDEYMFKLGLMTFLAVAMVILGFRLPLFDLLIGDHKFRIPVRERQFHFVLWGVFVVFGIVTFATADAVPILSAFKGGYTPEELDIQRGAFLKTRQGWEAGLAYISSVLVGALLPYSLARLFWMKKTTAGFLGLAVFGVYATSHLQKALIVQPVTPLGYLSARRIIWNYLGFAALIAGTLAIVYINVIISRGVQEDTGIQHIVESRGARSLERSVEKSATVPQDFFSADFQPSSTREYVAWRITAVPIFTASDAIKVLDVEFDGKHMLGATSSLVAAIFGMKRVNYDAEVYAIQWGETEVGRANSVYITDGYVNFGWPGVILFSMLVGLGFRVFAISDDEAMRSIWPLFAYNLIQASFIGSLLSAGFLLLFFIALFIRFEALPLTGDQSTSRTAVRRGDV